MEIILALLAWSNRIYYGVREVLYIFIESIDAFVENNLLFILINWNDPK